MAGAASPEDERGFFHIKKETLSSLRNLDNTVGRLRRKVHTACGMDFPVRPSYGKGYTFTDCCAVEA